MEKSRWEQIIREAYSNDDLRSVIAGFLASNGVELKTRSLSEDGERLYKIWLDRPHIAEVEHVAGRKHWAVKA